MQHPTVLQDQSFWATRYQSRTKKIGEFVYGADAPRSPVLATRKIPSDKDKSQRSSTTDSSKSQIPRSLQQNQSQAGTTTSSASLDNTSINIAAYGPTDPNKASNSAGSPSRPNLLTGIKLTPSQLSKTPTPVSATSAKSLITVFASDASTRSMSMSISGQPSPNHASPTQFRNPGQLPYTVEYTPPSLSGQDQMLSPYVHPYSIMADQKSKEKYGFASLPSRYALTLEDKLAMARFVHMRPRGESESLTKWWETFIEYVSILVA